MIQTVITRRLDDKQAKLFEELENRGGFSEAKKYEPLIEAGVARRYTLVNKTYTVSCLHPQATFMMRVPLITANTSKNAKEHAKFNAAQKLIAKWVLGCDTVKSEFVGFMCNFFKRHSVPPAIYSMPEFLKEEFLTDAKELDIEITQLHTDYRKAKCPLCNQINEIPKEQDIVFCDCGAEFSASI